MPQYVICDMDDCLIKTDALYEQWFGLLKQQPLLFFASLIWLIKGRSFFKQHLANRSKFNAAPLPFRQEIKSLLAQRKTQEDTVVVLASASPLPWVQAVADHLGLFDVVIGSSEHTNLKGRNKLAEIKKITNGQSFSYAGDHKADLPIWEAASEIIVVNPSSSLKAKIDALNKPTLVVSDKNRNSLRLMIKQLRPHQWVKNMLVFLPMIAGHQIFSFKTLLSGGFAFAGFSLAASFVYVLNDLLDLPSDRNHHTKKNRPFASGNLSIKWGLLLLPTLLGLSLAIASLLPLAFGGLIVGYILLNLAYSLYLKQSVIVDIIILSLMYTLRIYAGSAATSIPVSEWLLSFSTLFFFSLACVKRYTEIIRSKTKITIDGRGYRQVDHSMISSLGVGSGLISVLIILLYLQGNEVRSLYTFPQYLWFATPVLLFWVSRIWVLANRDEIHDDPVVFAVKDKVSWLCLVVLAVVFGIAS